MKKIFVLLFATLFVFSCTKDKALKQIDNELFGTWEIAGSTGFAGLQTFAPGNGGLLIFTRDGNFERKTHNTVLYKGKYSLQRKKDCHQRQNDIILTTDEPMATIFYVDIKKDSLLLSTPNCYADGGTAYYRRIK